MTRLGRNFQNGLRAVVEPIRIAGNCHYLVVTGSLLRYLFISRTCKLNYSCISYLDDNARPRFQVSRPLQVASCQPLTLDPNCMSINVPMLIEFLPAPNYFCQLLCYIYMLRCSHFYINYQLVLCVTPFIFQGSCMNSH